VTPPSAQPDGPPTGTAPVAISPSPSRARDHLPTRRGLSRRRWYQADSVDQLLNSLEEQLTAVTSDRARLAAEVNRLADLDLARRHGVLPTALPVQPVDRDQVRRLIRSQEAVDQLLDDASNQAAAIIDEARHHYLTMEQERSASGEGWRQRAERAEALVAKNAALIAGWAGYLTQALNRDREAAASRTRELGDAHAAALALLAELDQPHRPGGG
jgi:cell division septum initiation protein DivIVA